MKTRRILVITFVGIAVVAVVLLAASAYRKEKPFQNAPKLISAVQAFCRDQAASGRQLPSRVSLADLRRGGYLTTNDVSAFQGMEVKFSTHANDNVLAVALTPDGQYICLLADGSVQGLSRARYEEMLGNPGQRDGASNGSQPIHSEANSTSSAAGSRR
jgi:hypothetical protein